MKEFEKDIKEIDKEIIELEKKMIKAKENYNFLFLCVSLFFTVFNIFFIIMLIVIKCNFLN